MELNREIVIIYAESDNEPLGGGEKGWVTNLYKFFSVLLHQISPDRPEVVLMDQNNFDATRIEKAAAVLLLMTPNLMEQDKIVNSISGWIQMSNDEKELRVDGVPRVFKLLKKPFDADAELPELSDFYTYDFYYIDSLTGEANEFRRFFGAEAERGYWMKLVDLAYDVNFIFSRAFHKEDQTPFTRESDATVYLASVGRDLIIQRDVIKRELVRHGYEVLPKNSMPKDAEKFEAAVRENLSNSRLSIHLVGEDYGTRPEGSELSTVEIENNLATEHYKIIDQYNKKSNKDRRFSRLIWVSPDLTNMSERQKIFVEDLKGQASELEESEVLQVPLTELKSIIRNELTTGGRFKRSSSVFEESQPGNVNKIIYLMHDKVDTNESEKLESFLTRHGYEVLKPSFEGDVMDIRFVHQENLRKCDGSIIFYGDAQLEWIRTKLQDLLKAPGFGRSKPLLAKALYVKGQNRLDDISIKKYNAMVIEDPNGSSPDKVQPFLTKMEKL